MCTERFLKCCTATQGRTEPGKGHSQARGPCVSRSHNAGCPAHTAPPGRVTAGPMQARCAPRAHNHADPPALQHHTIYPTPPTLSRAQHSQHTSDGEPQLHHNPGIGGSGRSPER